MTDFDHPRDEPRHVPRIVTTDDGARVTCLCGWSATRPTTGQAARAWITHHDEETHP